MSDSSKKRPPTTLADIEERARLSIESEFRRLKAANLDGRHLRTCYCEGLRTIAETLYPAAVGLEEAAIDDLIELTFEAANRIELRQPNLLTRGFMAAVMDINDQLRKTSDPFDRPMPPERPHEYSPDGVKAQSPACHRREAFGGVEVDEGTRDAFRKYLQPEIERLRADILKVRAGGNTIQRTEEGAIRFSQFYSSPRFRAQYLKALERLSAELSKTWERIFPADAQWPRETSRAFFEPFVPFGVVLYDACAQELLTPLPSHNQYAHTLDFDLKTFVCDRIYPYLEKPIRTLQDALDADTRDEWPGEWAVRMGEAWRGFEHPRHDANHDRVRREFIDLYSYQPVWWGQLIERIHKGVSKRVIHWLAVHADHVAAATEAAASSSPVPKAVDARGSINGAASEEPPPAPATNVERPPSPRATSDAGSQQSEEPANTANGDTAIASGRRAFSLDSRSSTDRDLAPTVEAGRAAIVDDFLFRCNRETGLRVDLRRKHISLAVGHKYPRQFQYWQAGDPRATAADNRNFRRILSMVPAEFVKLLRQMRAIEPRQ